MRFFNIVGAPAGGGGGGTQAQLDALVASLGTVTKSTWTTVKTSAHTCVIHTIVKYDPTGGTFVLTLPSAIGLTADDTVAVLNVTTSITPVTVATTSAETITGNGGVAATTYTLNLAGQSTVFIPDGTGWFAFPGT